MFYILNDTKLLCQNKNYSTRKIKQLFIVWICAFLAFPAIIIIGPHLKFLNFILAMSWWWLLGLLILIRSIQFFYVIQHKKS